MASERPAMPYRKQLAIGEGILSFSTPIKHEEQLTSKQCPFGRLPPEIRNMIYHLCWMHEEPIRITVNENHLSALDRPGGRLIEGERHHIEDLVHFSTSKPVAVNASLLRANSTIHAEAIPILYGCTTFLFPGRYSWNDFSCFQSRLSSLASQNLRHIRIEFPKFKRFPWSTYDDLTGASKHGLRVLKDLACLESLTLWLKQPLRIDDFELLQHIRNSIPENCRINIDQIHYCIFNLEGYPVCKYTRFSKEINRMFLEWGWWTTGCLELVTWNEEFQKEKEWLDVYMPNGRSIFEPKA